jgi:hypothetical protein
MRQIILGYKYLNMKTQAETQAIYNVLIRELQNTCTHCFYDIGISSLSRSQETALENFYSSVQANPLTQALDPTFLEHIYQQAFHTGNIPKNRNHIAMQFTLTIGLNGNGTGRLESNSPTLNIWIDLDKVAELLNAHYNINPPYPFKMQHGTSKRETSRKSCFDQPFISYHKHVTYSAVNSCYEGDIRHPLSYCFIIGCIVSAIISLAALLIMTLAVTSMITLSATSIYTAAGIGVLAGLASYGLFKSQYKPFNTSTKPVPATEPEDLETIFKTYFKSTVDTEEDLKNQMPESHPMPPGNRYSSTKDTESRESGDFYIDIAFK